MERECALMVHVFAKRVLLELAVIRLTVRMNAVTQMADVEKMGYVNAKQDIWVMIVQ
jgi:hypothetical protein